MSDVQTSLAEAFRLPQIEPFTMKWGGYGSLLIIIVGIGGTGSPTIMSILRDVGGMRPEYQQRINVIAVDPDTVELKNIKRQMFFSKDIGRNKAEVLTSRYAAAFGLSNNVGYSDTPILTAADLLKLHAPTFTSHVLIIDCVDKNKPRVAIDTFINTFYTKTGIDNFTIGLISSGNGEWKGQVGFGVKTWRNGKAAESLCLPMPYRVHPELLDTTVDDAEEAMSCQERAVHNVQALTTNTVASALIMQYYTHAIRTFLELPVQPLKSALTYFNVQEAQFNSLKLTASYRDRYK